MSHSPLESSPMEISKSAAFDNDDADSDFGRVDDEEEEIELEEDDADEGGDTTTTNEADHTAATTIAESTNNTAAPSTAASAETTTAAPATDASALSAAATSAASSTTAAPASIVGANTPTPAVTVGPVANAVPPPAKVQDKTYKTAIKRLMSDHKQMENDPPEGVSGAPLDPSAPFVWRCAVFGPSDTPWEGGVFQLQMQFGAEYPQKPPAVRFISKMYHPNVFADGNLCLDIIQDKWSPVYSVSTILTSIQSLLADPNPASPANPEAARLYASKNEADQKEYRKRVRACVEKSTE